MAPSATQNAFHTLDTNWGPRSDTMSLGIPYSLKTWWTKVSLSLLMWGVFQWDEMGHFREPIHHRQDDSVTLGGGKPVTKSIAIRDLGRS